MNRMKNIFYAFLFAILGSVSYGQTGAVSDVSLSGITTGVCIAGQDMTVQFNWSGSRQGNMQGNKFIIELSSADGSFTSPVNLIEVSQIPNNQQTGLISARIPNTTLKSKITGGDAYKIRVRSTNPATEAETGSFSAYINPGNGYKLRFDQANFPGICEGGAPVPLSVTDKTRGNLYRWYKDDVLISGETSHTIQINEKGRYRVELAMGICSGETKAEWNINYGAGGDLSVNGANAVQVCIGTAHTFVASTNSSSNTYIWYKDNVEVHRGVGANTYTTPLQDAAGVYTVTEGAATSVCPTRSRNEVRLSYKGDFQANLSSSGSSTGVALMPGASVTLTASSQNIQSPSYEWFKDGVSIQSTQTNSINVNQPGVYYAMIKQSGECNSAKKTNDLRVEFPTEFIITIDTENAAYADCKFDNAVLMVKGIQARTASSSAQVQVPESAYDLFTYSWIKDGTPVSGSTSKAINLTMASQNGNYRVNATLPGFTGNVTSNSKSIALIDTNYINYVGLSSQEVTNGIVICADSSRVLEVTPRLMTAEYIWRRIDDSTELARGTGLNTLTVDKNNAGLIVVEVKEPSQQCAYMSKSLRVSLDDYKVTFLNPGNQILKQGKPISMEIFVNPPTLDVQVAWFKDDVQIPGANQKTFVTTEEGAYHAQVTQIGGCGTVRTTEKKSVFAPVSYDTELDFCRQDSRGNIKLKKFKAILSNGTQADVPEEEYGDYHFAWFEEGVRDTIQEDRVQYTIPVMDLQGWSSRNYRLELTAPEFPTTPFISTILVNNVKIFVNGQRPPIFEFEKVVYGNDVTPLQPRVPLKLEPNYVDINKTYEWEIENYAGRKASFDEAIFEASTDTGELESDTYYNYLGTYNLKISDPSGQGCEDVRNIQFVEKGFHSLSINDIPQPLDQSYIEVEAVEGIGVRVDFAGLYDFAPVIEPVGVTTAKDDRGNVYNYPTRPDCYINLVDPYAEPQCMEEWTDWLGFMVPSNFNFYCRRTIGAGATEEEIEACVASRMEYFKDLWRAFGMIPIVDESGEYTSWQFLRTGKYKISLPKQVINHDGTKSINIMAEVEIEVKGKEITEIPNTVILNSRIGNNKWILPAKYMKTSDYSVEIFSQNGEKVFDSSENTSEDYIGYGGEWPDNKARKLSADNPNKAMIYYYVITPNGEAVSNQQKIQGTVTVL